MILTRAIHIGACMTLLALAVFRLWIEGPALQGAAESTVRAFEPLDSRLRRTDSWSLLVSLVSGLVWLWLASADMIGVTPLQALRTDSLGSVLTQTRFGMLWQLRFGLLAALGGVYLFGAFTAQARSPVCWNRPGVVLAAALLGSLAWAGHAGAEAGSGHALLLSGDALHLLAAGVWPAGLLPFVLFQRHVLKSQRGSLLAVAVAVTRRFSSVSALVVASLAITGAINSWFLLGSWQALISTGYGRLLLLKILLFAIMIGIAAWNRRWILPQLVILKPGGPIELQQLALKSLARNVLAELCLGTGVLLLVGTLGVTPPATHS